MGRWRGAEGLKHLGEIVFGFGGGIAQGDGALKVPASFGHSIEPGKDGAEGSMQAGIVRIAIEGELEHRGGFFVSAILDEQSGELSGDCGGVWGGVEAVAEDFESLVGLAASRISESEIGALSGGALGLDPWLVEEVDDGSVVGIVDQVGGERIEGSGDLGIECEGGAPLRFGGRRVMGRVEGGGKHEVEAVVLVAETFGLLKRGNRFLQVSGQVETAAKHEDEVGHVLFSRLGLDRGGESVGGAVVLIVASEPDTEIGVVVGSR